MSQTQPTKPIRFNNPFALIQKKPSNWVGLVGSENGFLKFNTVENGLRAGLLNLYNGYFKNKKGNITTTQEITPKYVGTKWGETSATGDNPVNYADSIKRIAGFGYTTPIHWNEQADILKLARSIIQVEAGKLFVTDAQIITAYNSVNAIIKNTPNTAATGKKEPRIMGEEVMVWDSPYFWVFVATAATLLVVTYSKAIN